METRRTGTKGGEWPSEQMQRHAPQAAAAHSPSWLALALALLTPLVGSSVYPDCRSSRTVPQSGAGSQERALALAKATMALALALAL